MSKKPTTPLQRLQEQLKVVDILFEVRDARIPNSSRHPGVEDLFGNKPRIIVLTKEDLADPRATLLWVKHFNQVDKCQRGLALSLKQSKGKDKLLKIALDLTEDKRLAIARKGLLPRPIRACIVGLPNVGKSSLINWLIGKKKVKVADRPGVTTAHSWVRVHPQIELMDTPGILPHVAVRGEIAEKLAICSILPPDQYDLEELALKALEFLNRQYPHATELYRKSAIDAKLNNPAIDSEHATDNDQEADSEHATNRDQETDSEPIIDLSYIARARACLTTGGRLDTARAARYFMNDLRDGKLGRINFDLQPK